jgi:aerobic carbon-monoxide dehydrogenase small subunit
MTAVSLTVNGGAVSVEVEPRTHLADFLREDQGLTGTHLGCEHGVCGACTLLIDGAPARSCIAYTVACEGADVRTIEGLVDDPAIVRLRAAFTAEHALQCGYCTPGMLVTARDIVHRLPHANEADIRLELAGNLCRCTGYAGIVRAIRRVLAEGVLTAAAEPSPLPPLPVVSAPSRQTSAPAPGGNELRQTMRVGLPLAVVWAAIRDPALVASCVPGARLIEVAGDRLRGEVRASLGPIETVFAGDGTVVFDDAEHRAEISGAGRDNRTGTRLSARAVLALHALDDAATSAILSIDYTLRGPLAQFARPSVVREFAAEITGQVAANLEALLGGTSLAPEVRLSAGGLMLRAIWRRLRAMIGLD